MDNLKTSFGKQKVKQNQKTKMVQNVFREVAKKYDLMNDLMSFGTHRLWKNNLIELMNIQNSDKIIDVGSGTGDLIKIMQRKKPDVSITSIDLNIEMLKSSIAASTIEPPVPESPGLFTSSATKRNCISSENSMKFESKYVF